jgi:hypothetical protein
VAELFLKQAKAIAGIVSFHSVHSKSVPQPVGTYAVCPAGLGINQLGKSRPIGTLAYYLPSSVPVDTKDKPFSALRNRTSSGNVVSDHCQCDGIDRQRSDPAIFLLLGNGILDFVPALGAIRVASAKLVMARRARQLQPNFEMLDSYKTPDEVNISHYNTEGFRDAASQVKQESDE